MRESSEIATKKKHSSKNLQIFQIIRNSHRRCSVKLGVLKKCANFTAKYLCWSMSLIKLQKETPAQVFS